MQRPPQNLDVERSFSLKTLEYIFVLARLRFAHSPNMKIHTKKIAREL